MKNLIIALFALISVSASAQKDTAGLKMPVITGNVVYEQVFETPGKTRYQLFNDAQQWFIARYKSFRNIEVTDSVNVRVIGKGKEIVNYVGPLNVSLPFISRMTIQIDCKDGKFRSRMSSINLTPRDTSASGNFVTTPEELVDMLRELRTTLLDTFITAPTEIKNLSDDFICALDKSLFLLSLK